MNILLLSQFFWPEARTAPVHLAVLADELQKRGHSVTVVTGVPNHPLGHTYDGYEMRLWQWDSVRGIRVLRLPLFPDHSLSKVRRALNYGSFALSAASIGSILTRDVQPDVLFCYLPPLTIVLPVLILRKLHQVPVVYWMTDLWPDGLIAAGADLSQTTHQLLARLEALAYSQAEKIIVTSPGFKENLIEKGVSPHKLTTLVDWAEDSYFFPAARDTRLAKAYGMHGKFNVVYAGNLGTAQRLETVVHAAQLLKALCDIQFVFVGDGTDKQRLMQEVKAARLHNVRFIPHQPLIEIHRYLALADILLIHLSNDPLYRLQIPSKTIAYLASGKPILCAVAGNAADIVLSAGAGILCPPEDPQAMASAIKRLYDMPPEERDQMGRQGREAYLSDFTRDIQVTRVEEVLQQMHNEHRCEFS